MHHTRTLPLSCTFTAHWVRSTTASHQDTGRQAGNNDKSPPPDREAIKFYSHGSHVRTSACMQAPRTYQLARTAHEPAMPLLHFQLATRTRCSVRACDACMHLSRSTFVCMNFLCTVRLVVDGVACTGAQLLCFLVWYKVK
jgi:hypothetical protein